MDLKPTYWKRAIGKDYGKTKGQIVFADALYFRRLEECQCFFRDPNDIDQRSKLLRCLSICLLYGYIDYALELVNRYAILFADDERTRMLQSLRAEVPLSSRIPNFRGRRRIANLLHAVWRFVRPSEWSTCARVLGNFE